MLLVVEGDGWVDRLSVVFGLVELVPALPPEAVLVRRAIGVYAQVEDGGLSFFSWSGVSYSPMALKLLSSDEDQRVFDVLTMVQEIYIQASRRMMAENRALRWQSLWKRTRSRYRVYTQTIREKLRIDPMTQVLNRDGVLQVLNHAIQQARDTDTQMVLIVFDLDWFKRINDGYGHVVGDAVLRHVARVLREGVRRSDVIGRVGGEEFCAVLQSCDRDAGFRVAEKLRSAVGRWQIWVSLGEDVVPQVWAVSAEETVPLLGALPQDAPHHVAKADRFVVTLSAGLATFPDDFSNTTSSRLLQVIGNVTEADLLHYMADKALYQAKKKGRNRVCIYRSATVIDKHA